jgi:hypothetical protein
MIAADAPTELTLPLRINLQSEKVTRGIQDLLGGVPKLAER